MSTLLELLIKEHENIRMFTDKLEARCILFMEEGKIDFQELKGDIQFIRDYADERHHKKEEQILFEAMMEDLGEIAEKLIRGGMLVEHDMARLCVNDLEEAVHRYEKERRPEDKLAILAHAMGYCTLLRRHIEKENQAVYPFARRSLSKEKMSQLDQLALEYEKRFER